MTRDELSKRAREIHRTALATINENEREEGHSGTTRSWLWLRLRALYEAGWYARHAGYIDAGDRPDDAGGIANQLVQLLLDDMERYYLESPESQQQIEWEDPINE